MQALTNSFGLAVITETLDAAAALTTGFVPADLISLWREVCIKTMSESPPQVPDIPVFQDALAIVQPRNRFAGTTVRFLK